jgi:hypothetical protein
MNKVVLSEIMDDLQSAGPGRGAIVYLEGKTDVAILLALLGATDPRETSRGVLHEGVLICGLDDGGSSRVRQRLGVARQAGIPGIFGVVDGDGKTLAELASEFDTPYRGPGFRWKGYCIENLLARAGWPGPWGPEPDWRVALTELAPYVAFNRFTGKLRERLKDMGVVNFRHPAYPSPLHTGDDFVSVIGDVRKRLPELDIDGMFRDELAGCVAAIAQSLDEAHTLVNGKWLIEDLARRRTGFSQERCREEWAAHVRALGGDPEIRAWWRRVVAP